MYNNQKNVLDQVNTTDDKLYEDKIMASNNAYGNNSKDSNSIYQENEKNRDDGVYWKN